MRIERERWREQSLTLDVDRLIFLDETGVKTNMTRSYARAHGGSRALDHAPAGRWSTTTLLAAVGVRGTRAPLLLDGAMDAAAFTAWVEQLLAPQLTPGDIVVMDNLSSHKSASVRPLIEAAGAALLYLSPYSPDFNPSKKCGAR